MAHIIPSRLRKSEVEYELQARGTRVEPGEDKATLDTQLKQFLLEGKEILPLAPEDVQETEERARILAFIADTRAIFEEGGLSTDQVMSPSAEEVKEEEDEERISGGGGGSEVTYGIDDAPPWHLCLLLALQHYLAMIGAIVCIPFILTPALCMREDDPARAHVICTMVLVTGLVTWFQSTLGCRLPLVQGGTIAFLVPTLAILSLPQWRCPPQQEMEAMAPEDRTELWQVRMRELSGAIAVSAVLQVLLGCLGLVGVLVRYVTPLTIVPTVSLVGLTLFEDAASASSGHWGIASGTILALTVFSQCLDRVRVPIPGYSKSAGGCFVAWCRVFRLFPVLLTVALMWGVCGALTLGGALPQGHPARTDAKLRILHDAPWFRVPFPGQWGMPTVSTAGVLGMLAGVLACTVESISYYPTTARMCGAPPPPVHALNRGIATEGLGTILAALWGSGNGTNTFGENVGAIGVTRIGSRRVIQVAAALMVLQGLVGKFGAVFIIIPQPVVGGIFCVMFGMIAAFGLSALQYVDLNSPRNLYIVGFSLFFGLVLPKWMKGNPHAVQTGIEVADSVVTVLLSTSILVGGALGCLCDNLIPGTPEERGLIAWARQMKLEVDDQDDQGPPSTYDFPVGMGFVRRCKAFSYMPFMPTYKARKWRICSSKTQ